MQPACMIFPPAQGFLFANHTVVAHLPPVNEPCGPCPTVSHRYRNNDPTSQRMVGPHVSVPRARAAGIPLGVQHATERDRLAGAHKKTCLSGLVHSPRRFRRWRLREGRWWKPGPGVGSCALPFGAVVGVVEPPETASLLSARQPARAPSPTPMWLKPDSATWDREGEGSAR